MTSAPPRPAIVSLPAPPVRVFAPLLPVIVSLKADPVTLSMLVSVSLLPSPSLLAVPAVRLTVTAAAAAL